MNLKNRVRFFTGMTVSKGLEPYERVKKLIPLKIRREIEITLTKLRGLRGFDSIWEIIVGCEKGLPEEEFFAKNPIFGIWKN